MRRWCWGCSILSGRSAAGSGSMRIWLLPRSARWRRRAAGPGRGGRSGGHRHRHVQMTQAIRISVEVGMCAASSLLAGGGSALASTSLRASRWPKWLFRHPAYLRRRAADERYPPHAVARARRPLAGIDAGELAAKGDGAVLASWRRSLPPTVEMSLRSTALSAGGDLRYLGQFHELELALPMPGDAEWWEGPSIAQRFHDAHRTALWPWTWRRRSSWSICA